MYTISDAGQGVRICLTEGGQQIGWAASLEVAELIIEKLPKPRYRLEKIHKLPHIKEQPCSWRVFDTKLEVTIIVFEEEKFARIALEALNDQDQRNS